MKQNKITEFIKNIIYIILLFGISSLFMLAYINNDGTAQMFSLLTALALIALISGFSFIAVRKESIFYALSDLVCMALWAYPLYTKIQGNTILLIYIAFIPAIAGCISAIINKVKKNQENSKGASSAKKVLSILTIAVTIVSIVLTVISAIKLSDQLPKDIEKREQSYSAAVELANDMAREYKGSDLIIEEVLAKHQLTYDNYEANCYIIEEYDDIHITIDLTDNKNAKPAISVSSDNIGFGINKLFDMTIFEGKSEQISFE